MAAAADGNEAGPASSAVIVAVREIDQSIGQLVTELKALGQPANLVIVSDHGMAPVSSDRVIRINKRVDPSAFRVLTDGPFLAINPLPGREAEVEHKLLAADPHMQCWRKGELPARLEYGHNPRAPRIFCLAETGWLILTSEPGQSFSGGAHGYDNLAPDMAALFIGNGPDFAQGVQLAPFDNIAVYPLLARLIGVSPTVGGNDDLASQALRR